MNAGFKYFLLFILLSFSINTHADCVDASQLMQRGQTLRSQGQYLLATQQFSLVSALSCSPESRVLARYYYASSLYQLDEKEAAETELFELKKISLSPTLERKINLLLAWHEPAHQKFLNPVDQKIFADFAQDKKKLIEQEQIKKPWVAGSLSALVPGMGQVYNQNYSSAATSFVLNLLFLAAAIEFQNRDLHAPALAAGVIFSITYTGNILGSIESSRQINRAYQAPLLENLQKNRLPELEL